MPLFSAALSHLIGGIEYLYLERRKLTSAEFSFWDAEITQMYKKYLIRTLIHVSSTKKTLTYSVARTLSSEINSFIQAHFEHKIVFGFYRLPTELRDGNVFSRVFLPFCLSICLSTGESPGDHYPWCLGSHFTRPHSPSSPTSRQTSDVETNGPRPTPPQSDLEPSWPCPLLLTFGGQHWRPHQTRLLEDNPPLEQHLVVVLKHVRFASGWYESYWNAFFFFKLIVFPQMFGLKRLNSTEEIKFYLTL